MFDSRFEKKKSYLIFPILLNLPDSLMENNLRRV